jgi:son of sevenless
MLMTIRSNGIFPDENNTQGYNTYDTNPTGQLSDSFAHYDEETPLRTSSPLRTQASQFAASNGGYRTARNTSRRKSPPQMNGLLGNAPQPVVYVRALYDYEADDRTSLSFHEGDEIQVITQLESGWWDGVINGVRGWFPSNYCQIIPTPGGVPEDQSPPSPPIDDDPRRRSTSTSSGSDSPINDPIPVDTRSQFLLQEDHSPPDFWIPQATPDGRLFYYNTETGESSSELPLESPSFNENGPRDRMNVNIPDKTRPPPEMFNRVDDDDTESDGNSASELEGESIIAAAASLV